MEADAQFLEEFEKVSPESIFAMMLRETRKIVRKLEVTELILIDSFSFIIKETHLLVILPGRKLAIDIIWATCKIRHCRNR